MSTSVIKELSLGEKDFRRISEAIYQHCGINLRNGKKGLVQSRLAKLVRQSRFPSFTEYIDYILSADGEKEFVVAVDALSTNLTFFFREKQHFEFLQKTFLPNLISRKTKKSRNRILAWSAACSSGEEPYSIAITLTEIFQRSFDWDIKILATDISTRVLEQAQMGTYDSQKVEALTPQQKQQFLVANRIEGQKVYQVRNELKEMIRFRHLNLMDKWPFKGPFDIIFARNVMIYFDKPTQTSLVNRFCQCLNSGGLLCIGHSESLTGIDHELHYVQPATYIKN
jgi:chemotaxis protein methyltransferase CheR